MARHGYLREYDEGFGGGEDRDRGDWRDRDERDWRNRERGRGFMFDDDDRERFRDRDDDRGFFSCIGDEARSWFRDDERDYRTGREQREGRTSFSSHPDDHYRNWRDRQMQALDNDYADYCREREQQFHRDFDSWRQNRGQQGQQQGGGLDPDVLVLGAGSSDPGGLPPGAATEAKATASPESTATPGTDNSENSATGRGRR